jgi:hypothetical protein
LVNSESEFTYTICSLLDTAAGSVFVAVVAFSLFWQEAITETIAIAVAKPPNLRDVIFIGIFVF